MTLSSTSREDTEKSKMRVRKIPISEIIETCVKWKDTSE
jgi:hypothetical protein